MGVKKSNLLLWVATTLEILSRGRGTKKVKNRCITITLTFDIALLPLARKDEKCTNKPRRRRYSAIVCEELAQGPYTAGLLIAVAPRYRYCSGATFTVAV